MSLTCPFDSADRSVNLNAKVRIILDNVFIMLKKCAKNT
jgi:hypothetical protein